MIDPLKKKAVRELVLLHPKLMSVIFDSDENVSMSDIINVSFGMSSGEKLLIDTALHLVFEENKIDLNELLYKLDTASFKQFLLALLALRPDI